MRSRPGPVLLLDVAVGPAPSPSGRARDSPSRVWCCRWSPDRCGRRTVPRSGRTGGGRQRAVVDVERRLRLTVGDDHPQVHQCGGLVEEQFRCRGVPDPRVRSPRCPGAAGRRGRFPIVRQGPFEIARSARGGTAAAGRRRPTGRRVETDPRHGRPDRRSSVSRRTSPRCGRASGWPMKHGLLLPGDQSRLLAFRYPHRQRDRDDGSGSRGP